MRKKGRRYKTRVRRREGGRDSSHCGLRLLASTWLITVMLQPGASSGRSAPPSALAPPLLLGGSGLATCISTITSAVT